MRYRSKRAKRIRCRSCSAEFDTAALNECPICGASSFDKPDKRGNRGFDLQFGVFGCEDCSAVYVLADDRACCPRCGARHEGTDRHVARRLNGFGTDLVQLQERLEYAQSEPIALRGERINESDYAQWLHDVLVRLDTWSDQLPKAMSQGDFNEPDDAATKAAWTDLQELANEVIDSVLTLKHTLGPAHFLATHRTLAKGLSTFASGVIGFFMTLSSPTASVAMHRGQESQALLDKSLDTIVNACQMSGEPSAITHDNSGRYAIKYFGELASVGAHDPVLLRPLLPLIDLAWRTHDPDRRSQRTASVVEALTNAAAVSSGWLDTGETFHHRCSTAWRKVVAQHERLVRIEDEGRGRVGWADDMLDIASKLAEGPYRLYGSIIVVAADIAAGTVSVLNDNSIAPRRNFSDVVSGLGTVAPSLTEGVERLLRNAEAHYDYIPRDGGIEVNHFPPRGQKPDVDFVRNEDLVASVYNLHEACVAMSLGILRWTWNNGDIQTRERFRHHWLTA